MTREHEIEIVSHSHEPSRVVATFWWDGKKVQSDNEEVLDMVADMYPNGISIKRGTDFLKAVLQGFRSGYLSARRK